MELSAVQHNSAISAIVSKGRYGSISPFQN